MDRANCPHLRGPAPPNGPNGGPTRPRVDPSDFVAADRPGRGAGRPRLRARPVHRRARRAGRRARCRRSPCWSSPARPRRGAAACRRTSKRCRSARSRSAARGRMPATCTSRSRASRWRSRSSTGRPVPGAPLALMMLRGDYSGHALPGDNFTGRFFARWEPDPLVAVVEGAGFARRRSPRSTSRGSRSAAPGLRTLPDFVGPDLRILDVRAQPEPALRGRRARLRGSEQPVLARGDRRRRRVALPATRGTRCAHHRMGMTDLVKRATVGAGELRAAEYREGRARVERLVRLAPSPE